MADGKARRRAQQRWGGASGVPPEPQPEPRSATNLSAAAVDRQRLLGAASKQQQDRERSATPVPYRIAAALNLRELYGPEVDEACGVVEPAVDQWEAGELVPTAEQVELLAALTDFPVAFFYAPVEPETVRTFLCGKDGLTVVTSTIDERGVKHLEFEEHPKRRRRPKAQAPAGAPDPGKPHRFVKDPQTPSVCAVCEMPQANRRRHRT